MRSKQPTIRHQNRWHGWIYVASIVAFSGCDSPAEKDWKTAAVQGCVTVDGKPLEEGTIRFVPKGATVGPKTSFDVRAVEFQCLRRRRPLFLCLGTEHGSERKTQGGRIPY